MTVSKRKSIGKKDRFEVFKRDSFTCQYCGRKAPDVTLEVDHIEPVSKGGTNALLNLITSCFDCNSGKSDRRLSDNTVVDKQREQLESLQKRKEQIEMMFDWQKGLIGLDDDVQKKLSDYWSELATGYTLSELGIKGLRKLSNKFDFDEILRAMKISADSYFEHKEDGPTQKSVDYAWGKIGGICNLSRMEKENPQKRKLYYIRGILRNRLSYVNQWMSIELMESALESGVDMDEISAIAASANSWTGWRNRIAEAIGDQEEQDE